MEIFRFAAPGTEQLKICGETLTAFTYLNRLIIYPISFSRRGVYRRMDDYKSNFDRVQYLSWIPLRINTQFCSDGIDFQIQTKSRKNLSFDRLTKLSPIQTFHAF